MVVKGDWRGALVLLIKNPTKVQDYISASGTEEESARHQVTLVQNLFTFTLYKFILDDVHNSERYVKLAK